MQMWTRSCVINSCNVSESEAVETLVYVYRMQLRSAPLHWSVFSRNVSEHQSLAGVLGEGFL